jgi:hypothetical protein
MAAPGADAKPTGSLGFSIFRLEIIVRCNSRDTHRVEATPATDRKKH